MMLKLLRRLRATSALCISYFGIDIMLEEDDSPLNEPLR
jgi:hypothetical protein